MIDVFFSPLACLFQYGDSLVAQKLPDPVHMLVEAGQVSHEVGLPRGEPCYHHALADGSTELFRLRHARCPGFCLQQQFFGFGQAGFGQPAVNT